MPKEINPNDIPNMISKNMKIYMPNCGGESLLVAEVMKQNPECLDNVHLIGVWIPGVNNLDYADLNETAKATTFFVTPALKKTFLSGRTSYIPLHYSDVTSYLRTFDYDLTFLHLSPPNSEGLCSFGIAADFPPSVFDKSKKIIAHINPNMPSPPNSPLIKFSDLDYFFEKDFNVLEYDIGIANDPLVKLGQNVASLINDGDTVEIGIGKIQSTVLEPLKTRKNLSIHGGMICDPIIDLYNSGAISKLSETHQPITTGVAVGTRKLYDFVADCPDIYFKPVTFTHNINVLEKIDNLIAINSAIEVDLLGQANAEMINGTQVSGGGGLVDFLRGGRRSKNGKAIIALVSTTSDGKRSRIVCDFLPNTISTVPRADIDFVITENGIADLRNKSTTERTNELIYKAAAPQFIDQLEECRKKIPGI
ncbi:MAG: 4-hydroxybutyrate CoA-transferase [Rhodospirillaceae bacterium]|nr:4-hydroxybutyrate CoA-transferase [Rhodospirillaceae bacterium]|tara:strand:- start:15042 stop:16307 length:1266 start_codon:yes stop_codon:yes gene_type:complete